MYSDFKFNAQDLETLGWVNEGIHWYYHSSRGKHTHLHAVVGEGSGSSEFERVTLKVNFQFVGHIFDRTTGTLNWALLDTSKLGSDLITEFRRALKPFQ